MSELSERELKLWRALKLSHERLGALYKETGDYELGEFIDGELWPLLYGDDDHRFTRLSAERDHMLAGQYASN